MGFKIWNGKLLVNDSGQPIDCSTCPCSAACGFCAAGTLPNTILFTLDNVGNSSCLDCGELNQTYTLSATTDPCIYEGEAGTACGSVTVNLQFLSTQISGGFNLDAIPMFGFQVNLEGPYSCTTGRSATVTAPQTDPCDFTAATVDFEGVL
jgi:hypothetical protein